MAQTEMTVTTVGMEEVENYLKGLNESSFPIVQDEFQKSTLAVGNKVRDMAQLQVRSGALRRSIQQSVSGSSLKDINGSVYSAQGSGAAGVVYARIHEFGGTIKPIDKYKWVPGGPYLNIPTSANKTGAGVTRMSAKEIFDKGGYVRKAGSGYGLFLGTQMMMFLIKGPVTIPPRLGMMKAAEDEIPTMLSRIAARIIEGKV
jgi:hypothetical protein